MKLQQRLLLLGKLRDYMLSEDPLWMAAKEKAFYENNWFIPEFISLQVNNIAQEYLDPLKLQKISLEYSIPDQPPIRRTVGIVMAGNLPLVGFHDFLSVFSPDITRK